MTALLDVLKTERQRHQEALEHIDELLRIEGQNGSSASSSTRSRTTSVPSAPRRSSDEDRESRGPGRDPFRATQFLQIVKENPGISVSEAAEKMEIKGPNYLYRLAKGELEKGTLVKEGNGYRVAAA